MEELQQKIVDGLKDKTVEHKLYARELTLTVREGDLMGVMQSLRDKYGFNFFSDMQSIDHFRDKQRFEVSYNIMNLDAPSRIRVKTFVEEGDPTVDSLVSVWPAADWNERETFDMMGIKFRNHPDLRRILTWETYPAHPLRKDYPLRGEGEREMFKVVDRTSA